MKSIIQKVLMLVGLVSVVPFFSQAASLSCSSDYSTYLTNKYDANFTTDLSDGVGEYVYEWSGDVTASGVTSLSGVNFSSAGKKYITVTASSTDEKLWASCNVDVYDLESRTPDVGASCSPNNDMAPIGQEITWSATAGPLGPYTITWGGDGSLSGSGDRVSTTASSSFSGLEMSAWLASVVSTRYPGDTAFHSFDITTNTPCDSTVYIVPAVYSNPEDLTVTGSCSVSTASAYVNDLVTWNSSIVVGGNIETPVYSWSDASDNSVLGTGSTISKAYTTIGEKSAYVVVQDGARSKRIDCSNTVEVRNRSTGNHHSSNGSDSTDNGTGTSTATSTPNNGTGTSTDNGTGSNGDNNGNGNNNQGGNASSTDAEYNIDSNFNFDNDLRLGDRGEDVANLQNRLKEEGFYSGLVGGYFGELTQSALMAYQKSVGLPATGVMDQVVRARLNIETKQALADNLKKLAEENPSGFLAAAAGLLKTNVKNVIFIILGLIALGLLSWGVMVGLKKLKNTV